MMSDDSPGETSGQSLYDRNLELLAERLRWPDEALQHVREIEREHPGYSAYWSNGQLPRMSGAGYYGFRRDRRWGEPVMYGRTPGELSALLADDAKKHRSRW